MYLKEPKKVIAVDLDQTLAHTMESLVEWHNAIYGTCYKVTDFNTYDYWKVWGGTQEESCVKIREFYESSYFDEIKPIRDFALEALKMLKRRHFTLVIVTSRQQFVAEKTKRFVDRHYPGIFESIYFCNLDLSDNEQLEYISKPKSVICQEIGVDVLIDDCLQHALDCSSLGIDVLLYDRKGKYLWNHQELKEQEQQKFTLTSTSKRLYQRNQPIIKNIHRMLNWREIIAQFPKPSSPLKYCCYSWPSLVHQVGYEGEEEEEDVEEEEDESVEDDHESDYQVPPMTNYYNGYETVEVEEMSEEEEEYPLWRQNESQQNRVWA